MYSYLCHHGLRARERERDRSSYNRGKEEAFGVTSSSVVRPHISSTRATTTPLVSNRQSHGAKTRRWGALFFVSSSFLFDRHRVLLDDARCCVTSL